MAARQNLSGAAFSSPVTVPTPAFGDSSTIVPNTAWVANAIDGVGTISTAGGTTTTLTAAQASTAVVVVTGTLTSNAVIVVPNNIVMTVCNRTTGAFSLTIKTAAGTGVVIGQGYNRNLLADGTNVVFEQTDFGGVTGGSIDATSIGATTPSSGVFTSILSASFSMNGAAGSYRGFYWQTAFSARVSMQVDGTTESGANAGSNFQFNVFSDTGALLSTPINITRATGLVSMFNVGITGGAINSTPLGGTTPAAGAFTSLAASGAVSGAGFTAYMASPPAIGGTAPAAGGFTSLAASGTVSGNGFINYLASPPAIGGTAAAAGTFTTLASTGHALRSTATGLTAAGTTQPTALALTKTINVITTTAVSTGVMLPNGGIGAEYIIINRGANTLSIYPPGSGVIDALAASAATTTATLTTKRFVQVTATQYYTA